MDSKKYWIFNIVCHQCNSHSESYTFTINPDSSSDIRPHPKRQRQMLLTPSVSNRSRVPSQVATSYIQFDLKLHVQIQPAIVNYYGKQQFNCIASVDTAGGNTTTKSTLIKLRRLINSIHYLAKDDAHVLAWCKTIPTQRSSDWITL